MADLHSVLDDVVASSLAGAHSQLALRSGNAARYPVGIPAFAAIRGPQNAALRDLAELVPPEDAVALAVPLGEAAGSDWIELDRIELLQMICEVAVEAPAEVPDPLTTSDVDDMLALTAATQPGPFGPRSIEMGSFFGLRSAGELVAMAGERLHPEGHVEISGVCTAEGQRGKGLAERLVRHVASRIQARGETPFLHIEVGSGGSPGVRRLYERLGFRARRASSLTILQRAGDS